MTSRIKFDRELGQFRDKRTDRLLRLHPRITRIPVSGGWLFIIKPLEKLPPPSKADKRRWGRFA